MTINLNSLFIKVFFAFSFVGFTTSSLAKSEAKLLTLPCNACHGDSGVSTNSQIPNLAGQKEGYMLAQMKAFRNGSRDNEMLSLLLADYSEEELIKISKYYANIPFIKSKALVINKAGQNIRSGCISCHGMNGKTVNTTWPNLAGQNRDYLLQQLKDFSSKKRTSMIMNVIANELNEQQMKDVAEYYQQQGSNK
jgi:cytochrome c553